MAGAGATIQSLGRTLPDNGHLSDTLVVKDGSTVHNLISIPKFDRLGYTTVFTGGKGTVYDCEGNIIVSAELSSNNLYEFDIRDLYRSGEEQAYLLSFETPTTLEVLHDRLAHRNKAKHQTCHQRESHSHSKKTRKKHKRIFKSPLRCLLSGEINQVPEAQA